MAGNNRRGGIIYLKAGGVQYEAKGEFTYDIGGFKRTSIVGADGVHGYTREAKAAFIEGAITDSPDLDLRAFAELEDVTVTLELDNGKTIILPEAWYAGDAAVKTKEGEIPVRFEAKKGEEMPA